MAGRDEADTYSPSEVRLPIDGGGDTDLVLVPKDGAGPGGHHRVTVVDEAGRRRRVFDVNLYATKKSAAQGLLDLALLMANASQLKSIMQTQGNHQFYTPMLALLSVSIAMPCSSLLIVGLALLFLGRKRISADDMDEQARRQTAIADRINNWIIAGVFILTVVNTKATWAEQEDIVISGISGRFPESEHMAEFADNLFAGKDMVTDDDRRWEPGLYGLPRRNGKLKTWSKFDASFFGIPPKQAIYMDPQVRTLLEVAFEAIVDAGLSPASLKGSRTGVFVGSSGSESMPALTRDPELVSGYSMSGCASAMFANRLSFALDLKGPSFNIDTACNSSLLALQVAMTAMRDGQCTAALVCGSNAVLTPTNALQFLRLGVLSPDGACKSFDADGSGYAKSEGLGVMLLQRRPTARRLYATLVHAKSNTDGFKDEGVHFPSGATQGALLREVYAECQLSPAAVSYVEAHGTGTKVGDPQEANAIADVFCPKEMERDVLLMGSVKSNMGHAEPASGVASVAKVILCMEQGRIPPNLHFKTPNPAIPALADGRIQMVTEPTLWSGGYVGINSFGFGGANTHVLLRSNPEALPNALRDDSAIHSPPPIKEEEAALPRLVCYAARTELGLRKILEEVAGARDAGLDALLAESAQLPTSLYPFRGFALEETSGGQVNIHSQKCEGQRRPVWLVFNGMGSQWAGMGRMLAEALPSFRASLEAASAITRPLGIDPLALIADDPNNNTQAFNNVRNIIVANIAIQVALVDVLRELGVEWDGIIGHSTGEIPCGYADKSMTLEQTMHLAFHRGDLLMKAELPEGAMAAVGLSWEQALDVCKGTEVVAACHNAADSVTLSGPAGAVRELMDKLSADGVFAREVDCSGVPFHSPLLADLRSQLLARFREVLPKPAPRGSGWASTSLGAEVEEDKSGLAPAWSGLCSAEYHVNNVLSPVRFFEALSKRVPENAVTVEVGPHALLAAVLRRSLPNGLHIGLMSKRASNSLIHTLSSLGKIYAAGIPITVQRLYPSQEWPVRRGTPMLAHLIAQSWDHSGDWPVMNGPNAGLSDTGDSSGMTITCDPFDKENDENAYLLDHQIDGRSIFPFTGYPVMAWKALCKIKGLDFLKTPVTFSNLRVFRPTLLTKAVRLGIRVLPEGGKFEVTEGGSVVFSGTVTLTEEGEPFFYHQLAKPFKLGSLSDQIVLQPEDVYKELRLRGYEYGAHFRGIHSVGNEGSEGLLRWTGNWVTFLDTLLQLSIAAGEREDSLRLPVRLRYLRIDPQRHLNSLRLNGDIRLVEAHIGSDVGGILAGGVELGGLIAQTAQRRVHPPNLFLEVFEFVPYENNECFKKDTQFKNDIRRSIHVWPLAFLPPQPFTGGWEATEVALAKGLESLPEELRSELDCWEQVQSRHIPFLRSSGEEPSPLILEALSSLAEEGLEGPWRTLLRTAALSEKVFLAAWHQRNLKLLLDIVTENTPTHSLHCLALGKDIDAVVAAAAGFQSSNPLTETAWTIGTPQDRPEDAQVHDAVSEELDLDTQPTLPDSAKPSHVIVANRVLSRKSDSDTGAFLEQLKSYMAEGGFLLMHEINGSPDAVCLVDLLTEPATKTQYHSHEEWLDLFQEAGLVVAAWQRDEVLPSVLYLLRKIPAPEALANPRLISVDDVDEFSWLADAQADLAETTSSGRLWLTSRRRDNGLVGLGNCFREEMVKLSGRWPPPRTLADIGLGEEGAAPEWTEELVTRIGHKDLLHNLYRDGVFGSMRTFIVQEGEDHKRVITEHAYMANLIIGDLSSLSWVQNPNAHFKPYKQNGRELIDIHYAALNFRDIMLATGRLSKDAIPGKFADPDCVLGSEFSGVSRFNGRRVMGIAAGQALATTFVSDPHMTFDVPDKWSLAEAATTAVAYMTVIYGLLIRGRLRKGERLLVHSGSGGVGQAAINVALHHECEVFTTVSTDEKRDFLLKTFPQLQADHIFNSRSTEFELHVMTATKGKGLNVVLNSLSEDKLQASVRCLARHGRFLEIGKFDLANNSTLGLEVFLKNIEFHGILLDSIDDPADWSLLKHYFMEGVDSGMVKPIPSTIFPSTKVEEAFRYMAQGKHIGKVLIQLRENPKMAFSPKVTAVGRPHCAPGHSYLITGGLGGFGLQLAAYLVRKGAQNESMGNGVGVGDTKDEALRLILTSRSGIRSPYQARVIHSLRQAGVDVRISPLDVSDINQCRELLDECARKGPIGGIFHLAMVLRDSLFENQNVANFKESGGIKYLGTQNLDVGSREVCGRELRWFVCFSSVSSGRGNSGQTAYGWANSAMERVCEARQKAGLPGTAIQWGAIGDVGVIVETMGSNTSVVGGTLPQRMPSCLAVLDNFLSWSAPVVSSFVRADTRRRSAVPGADIVATIARIIGLTDPSTLNPNTPLADLGLDSLMGMEIKQAVERDANVVLSMKEIQTLTITKLKVLMSEGPSSSSKRITEDTVKDLDQLREQMQKIFKLRLDVNDCKATESVRRINGVSDGEPVFFLHTMEGIASPLETLGELVTAPAFCLQCTEATPLDSIQAMAGHYLSEAQRVRKELGAETNPMRLVGYSYGACLAFEMALALEAAGEPSPTIVLIDSSHQYMAAYRNLYRAVYKLAEEESLVENAEFETELVSQMATRFASFNYAELRAQVRGAENWAGRVEAATTAVMAGGLLLEPETFRWLAASVKGRYLAADKYEPSGNLKGSLTLIRATQGPAKESEVAGDYGLSPIVEGELKKRGLKVEVVKVVGDHEGLAQKNAGETVAVLNRLFS